MLSIEKCKEILEKDGEKYTDEQVERIREILYRFAAIEYGAFKTQKNNNEQADALNIKIDSSPISHTQALHHCKTLLK